MSPKFSTINYSQPLPDLTIPFSITCPPDTDVWEKPPSTHSFNAPIIYQSVTKSSFRRASVTVSAKWQHLYDQGGLCLIIPSANADGSRRWIKTGIEFFNNQPQVSVVATDRWSDWSLRPMLDAKSTAATIELDSNEDGSLWVWLVGEDGSKHPLREVTWWGALEVEQGCLVGVYAAKPAKEKESLVVEFKDFVVESR